MACVKVAPILASCSLRWWGSYDANFYRTCNVNLKPAALVLQSLAKQHTSEFPDSKVHGANMGPIWGLQDPGGPHVGSMNLAICVDAPNHDW